MSINKASATSLWGSAMLEWALFILAYVVGYGLGRHDGRRIEERSWINSYNSSGLDDGPREVE